MDTASDARRRARAVALALVCATPVGFLLALAFQWPSDFVLEESVDSRVTAGDVVTGTVTSMPLAPFMVLVLALVASGSRRWWGTAALVVLALLGAVFTAGGIGELTSDTAEVPRAVLVVAGAVYVLAGAALCLSALTALVAQRRRRG